MLSEAHEVDLNGKKARPAGVPSLQYNPLCAADSISTLVCFHQNILTRLAATACCICQHKVKLLLPNCLNFLTYHLDRAVLG